MKGKILITGAAGRIGNFIVSHFTGQYKFVLTDIHKSKNAFDFPFIQAEISDIDAMRKICEGIDQVIHLAADPRLEAPWDSILHNNIIGVYNIYQAAYETGCSRVIFASSINAVSGYPKDVQVQTNMPPRPSNIYGASKVWGEAVARFYADKKKISSICLRFGWVTHRNNKQLKMTNPNLDMVLTYEDLAKLVQASIEAPPDLQFGIFHGISNNRCKRLDISDTQKILGYEPEDDSFALAELNKT
jgi:nucleoside-diphosphate-sugar epimerase